MNSSRLIWALYTTPAAHRHSVDHRPFRRSDMEFMPALGYAACTFGGSDMKSALNLRSAALTKSVKNLRKFQKGKFASARPGRQQR